jgi:hypothetical protein
MNDELSFLDVAHLAANLLSKKIKDDPAIVMNVERRKREVEEAVVLAREIVAELHRQMN